MRTTVNLDDDVLEEASERARVLNISLGKAVSDLARRGMVSAPPVKRVEDLLVFDPPKKSPRISARQIKEALREFP